MPPCVGTQKKIAFVKGANPNYDDLVVTLSGTALSEKPPFKVVGNWNRARYVFGRQVRPCLPLVLHALVPHPEKVGLRGIMPQSEGNRGQGTLGAQNRLFHGDNVLQVVENIGGRDRGRTGDLIVANTGD
jgi:hypothetical protein